MRTLLTFLFILSSLTLTAQLPYHLSWGKDLPLFIGGNALFFGGVLLSDVAPLTPTEISQLDPMNINAFDRGATENFSTAADNRSDIGLYGGAILGVGSNIVFPLTGNSKGKQFWKEVGTLAVIWYEVNTLVTGLTFTTKALVLRPRPFVYNPTAPMELKTEVDARFSYFSGHTSITTVNFFLLGKFYADYFPDSKWKPAVWAASAIIPAWTGIERYNAGKHFLTDVITGYAIGALGGILIPHLHKKKDDKVSLNIYPAGFENGYGVGMSLKF